MSIAAASICTPLQRNLSSFESRLQGERLIVWRCRIAGKEESGPAVCIGEAVWVKLAALRSTHPCMKTIEQVFPRPWPTHKEGWGVGAEWVDQFIRQWQA
jgi:hypothetical protein